MLHQKNNHRSSSLQPSNFDNKISLSKALQQAYQDVYPKEIFSTTLLLRNKRPQFTQNTLIDWKLNDFR